MSKIILLTQEVCPKCHVLKQFLGGRDYDEVKREDDPKRFMALARKHGIMATPALIAGDSVLMDTKKELVDDFFEKHGNT